MYTLFLLLVKNKLDHLQRKDFNDTKQIFIHFYVMLDGALKGCESYFTADQSGHFTSAAL